MLNQVLLQARPDIDGLVRHYDGELRGVRVVKERSGTFIDSIGADTQVNWYEVFSKFVASAAKVVGQVVGSPGAKREAVIVAAMQFWQESVRPLLASKVGAPWIFDGFIAPAIEKQVPALAGGLYDALQTVLARILGGAFQSGTTVAGEAGNQGGVAGSQGAAYTPSPWSPY